MKLQVSSFFLFIVLGILPSYSMQAPLKGKKEASDNAISEAKQQIYQKICEVYQLANQYEYLEKDKPTAFGLMEELKILIALTEKIDTLDIFAFRKLLYEKVDKLGKLRDLTQEEVDLAHNAFNELDWLCKAGKLQLLSSEQKEVLQILEKEINHFKNRPLGRVETRTYIRYSRILAIYIQRMLFINQEIATTPEHASKHPTATQLFQQIINEWLFEAIIIGNCSQITKLLTVYYADPNAVNLAGQTILDVAIKLQSNEIIEILVKAGAKLLNDQEGTFFFVNHSSEITKLLHDYNTIAPDQYETIEHSMHQLKPLLTPSCFPEKQRNAAQQLIQEIHAITEGKPLKELPTYKLFRLHTILPNITVSLKSLTSLASHTQIKQFEKEIEKIKSFLWLEYYVTDLPIVEKVIKIVTTLENRYVPNFTYYYMKQALKYLQRKQNQLKDLLRERDI